MVDVILTINSGSSSLKFAVYPAGDKDGPPLLRGSVNGIGRKPQLALRDETGAVQTGGRFADIPLDAEHEWIISALLELFGEQYGQFNLVAAGHRVVHGGQDFSGPAVIDEATREKLNAFIPLAPLHQPHNLAAIDVLRENAPKVVQVATFDTSFHRTQPKLAQLFGLPRRLSDAGIIRYGFHGLSYEYMAGKLPDILGERASRRILVAHLGNGASMCAMKDWQGIATTMGFTALHGLMMGRRCGSLDAGVVLHLLQEHGMTPDEINHLLYRESGLLGVSGISNNMQVLQQSDDPRAEEAIELYCYRAAGEAGALITALEGLDAIVFTAGIGENSALVRQRICERLAWLGLEIDSLANEENATIISTAGSKISAVVVPTDEEIVIANATRRLITAGA